MSRLGLALFSCVAVAGLARAESPPSVPGAAARPRVGLVLGGGGARGAAHIGVLKALDRLRVPVDLVTGTSVGAVVGGLFAAGVAPEQLEAQFLAEDWNALFVDSAPRRELSFRRKQDDQQQLFKFRMSLHQGRITLPSGLVAGQKLGLLLRALTLPTATDQNFDQLPTPFRAVATDLATGEKVVLGGGDLVAAVRASMAVPGVFAPVDLGGRRLVDGGLTDNLPIDVAQELGATLVIAVDIGAPLLTRDQLRSVVDVSIQSSSLVTQSSTRAQIALLDPTDFLVKPTLGEISSASFDPVSVRAAIAAGETAIDAIADQLAPLALPREEYARWLAARRRAPLDAPVVRSLRINNESDLDPRALAARFETAVGQRLDLVQLRRDLARIYELDRFERVLFHLEPDRDGVAVVVDSWPRPTGRSFLKVGLNLTSDLRNTGRFDALASYTATGLNARGGEWKTLTSIGENTRIETEWYQPLDFSGRFFVAPQLRYGRRALTVADDTGDRIDLRASGAGARLDLGRQWGKYAELRAGWSIQALRTRPEPALDRLEPASIDRRAYRFRLTIDQLDNVNFPRRGLFAESECERIATSLVEARHYDRCEAAALLAVTRGANTLLLGGRIGSALGATLPTIDQFTLGGLGQISGLRPDQLRGDSYTLGRLLYLRQLSALPPGLGTGIYVGVSLELGQIQAGGRTLYGDGATAAGAAFVGAETVLGPLYLAFGRTWRGDGAAYLYLGRTF